MQLDEVQLHGGRLDGVRPDGVRLDRITGEIWGAILGLPLDGHRAVDTFEPDERVVTGVVQIAGDFEGAVSLQLPERLAQRAAEAMFAMAGDEVTDEEVVDTVGELANMTGGNVKSALRGSCTLSLPSVTSGRDYQVSVPGAVVRERLGLDCEGDLVVVSMLERNASS
ncbi:MAG: chemotaxis protein CheX [Nitriliruptoraceae bacterium]